MRGRSYEASRVWPVRRFLVSRLGACSSFAWWAGSRRRLPILSSRTATRAAATPTRRGEVVAGVGWTLGYVVVDGLLVCLAIGLVSWAARGRWPRARRLTFIPAGGLVVAVAVLAVILVPQLDEGRARPDCATFTFSRSEFRAVEAHARQANADGIERCRLLDGKTTTEVRRLLGRPATSGRIGVGRYWRYPGLELFFVDGRVREADAGAS